MKAVIAIDSYKGSLSSMQAGLAAMEGIHRVEPDCQVIVCPIADGGEGTVDALTEGLNGAKYMINVTGPLGTPVAATYGILQDGTAVMEMSAAAGITLVPPAQRNPLYTTTYGVGEMIKDAIQRGCQNFIIGIGGSATNDGGIGMLQALGYGILDKAGTQVPHGAIGLQKIHTITGENAMPELKECRFHIACDVTNPLCGERGSSAVYGPQKGADLEMIRQMDDWLHHFGLLAEEICENADQTYPGAGAAGGLGFAFASFLNGKLCPGVELILEQTGLEKEMADADVVITGEGRLDGQTVMGKAPIGVAKLAKKHCIPVIAFGGSVSAEAKICNEYGIDAFFPILRRVCTLEDAMDIENARKNMADTVEQVFRLRKTFCI